MNSINFKSTSIMKNFKKALKASKHITPGEQIHFTIGSPHKTIFQRNSHANKYIDKIISEIMQIPIMQNNFKKKDLKEDIILILEVLEINNALNMNKNEFEELYLELITEFENKIKKHVETEFEEFECVFHVENLKLKHELKIGDVTLFPFKNDKRFQEFNKQTFNKFFKENEVYAITKVYGSKEYAHSKSQLKIKIVLNILKLFLNDYQCNFNLDGDILNPKNRFYILIKPTDDIIAGFSPSSTNFGCNFNEEVQDTEFLNILSILLNSKPKSEFENRLLTSIYWFGEALSVQTTHFSKIENEHSSKIENIEFFEAYNKLIYIIISLETLFVYDDEKKSKAISYKVSKLIANPGYEKEIEKFIEKIYDFRSKIVHSGVVYVSKEDMKKLIDYTRYALFNVIYINYLYSDKIRYFNRIL